MNKQIYIYVEYLHVYIYIYACMYTSWIHYTYIYMYTQKRNCLDTDMVYHVWSTITCSNPRSPSKCHYN